MGKPPLDAIDAAMREYYERRAGEYDEWYLRLGRFADRPDREGWWQELRLLGERVSAFGNGNLLEIASGTGWWTQYLARRARVTVLDYAPSMLRQVGARLESQKLDAFQIRGDAYRLPIRAASFDSCFMGFWLSHVPFARLDEFLGEVRRVMKPNGLLMAVDSAGFDGEAESGEVNPGMEKFQERILNDGSRHQVLKIQHSPETMRKILGPLGPVLDAWHTGRLFVGAMVRVVKN